MLCRTSVWPLPLSAPSLLLSLYPSLETHHAFLGCALVTSTACLRSCLRWRSQHMSGSEMLQVVRHSTHAESFDSFGDLEVCRTQKSCYCVHLFHGVGSENGRRMIGTSFQLLREKVRKPERNFHGLQGGFD